MAKEIAVDVIERQEWLEPVEEQLQSAVRAVYEAGGEAGRQVKNALHGTWLGHPVHPILTDIPLGAWTVTLILDLIEETGETKYRPGADASLKIGLLGAVGAAITGLTDWKEIDPPARRVGIVHGLLNTAVTGLYAASLMQRSSKNRCTGRALAYTGFALSIFSAYLGGHLVYAKKIGADHSYGPDYPKEWTTVTSVVDLQEGQLRRVEVNGAKLVLLKRGDRVYALGEVCSHLGGPLADGKIEEDHSVRCPWHGSRFCMETGEVLDGPSTHPQPAFETRVEDGQVQVRAKSV